MNIEQPQPKPFYEYCKGRELKPDILKNIRDLKPEAWMIDNTLLAGVEYILSDVLIKNDIKPRDVTLKMSQNASKILESKLGR